MPFDYSSTINYTSALLSAITLNSALGTEQTRPIHSLIYTPSENTLEPI